MSSDNESEFDKKQRELEELLEKEKKPSTTTTIKDENKEEEQTVDFSSGEEEEEEPSKTDFTNPDSPPIDYTENIKYLKNTSQKLDDEIENLKKQLNEVKLAYDKQIEPYKQRIIFWFQQALLIKKITVKRRADFKNTDDDKKNHIKELDKKYFKIREVLIKHIPSMASIISDDLPDPFSSIM